MFRTIVGDERTTYYLKPLPIQEKPWTGDVVRAVEAGETGIFTVNVSPKKDYAKYKQSGCEPAPCDNLEGTFIMNQT